MNTESVFKQGDIRMKKITTLNMRISPILFSALLFFVLTISLACSLTTLPVGSADLNAIQAQQVTQIAHGIDTPTQTPKTCIVTATVLHLRECAGLDCKIKDWLDQGEKLSVQQNVNGWYQITTPTGESGWINSNYCGGL